jgi:hypothetical protein
MSRKSSMRRMDSRLGAVARVEELRRWFPITSLPILTSVPLPTPLPSLPPLSAAREYAKLILAALNDLQLRFLFALFSLYLPLLLSVGRFPSFIQFTSWILALAMANLLSSSFVISIPSFNPFSLQRFLSSSSSSYSFQ